MQTQLAPPALRFLLAPQLLLGLPLNLLRDPPLALLALQDIPLVIPPLARADRRGLLLARDPFFCHLQGLVDALQLGGDQLQ